MGPLVVKQGRLRELLIKVARELHKGQTMLIRSTLIESSLILPCLTTNGPKPWSTYLRQVAEPVPRHAATTSSRAAVTTDKTSDFRAIIISVVTAARDEIAAAWRGTCSATCLK